MTKQQYHMTSEYKQTATVVNCFLFGLSFLVLSFVFSPSSAFASFDKDLVPGMLHNAQVMDLQAFLSDQGLYDGPITGNYLNLTQQSVRRFQSKQGVTPVSGYFGPLTRKEANNIGDVTPDVVTLHITDTVVQSDKAQKIKDLIALIAQLQKQLADIQSQSPTTILPSTQTPVYTTGMTETNNATNTPVAGAEVPAQVVPQLLTPQLSVVMPQAIQKGTTHILLATIQVSNIDESIILDTAQVNVSGYDGWNPTLSIYYRGQTVPGNSIPLVKGQNYPIQVYVDSVPDQIGNIVFTMGDWKFSGQTSGNIKSATGVPSPTTIPVQE